MHLIYIEFGGKKERQRQVAPLKRIILTLWLSNNAARGQGPRLRNKRAIISQSLYIRHEHGAANHRWMKMITFSFIIMSTSCICHILTNECIKDSVLYINHFKNLYQAFKKENGSIILKMCSLNFYTIILFHQYFPFLRFIFNVFKKSVSGKRLIENHQYLSFLILSKIGSPLDIL